MPEGDTLFKTAARLKPALQDHRLVRFEAPRLRGEAPKLGERVVLVEARGKHLLVHFEGGLVLRTHLRMTGSWHLYRERWQKPAHLARVVVGVDSGWVAVWEVAARQLQSNLGRGERRTHPAGLAVYGRRGQPCRRCGTPIQMTRHGDLARSTYWCPTCQPAAVPPVEGDPSTLPGHDR